MEPYKWVAAQNITIQKFASIIRVSRSQAHKYIHENVIPKPGTMLKIFDVTNGGITPNDFFGISAKIEQIGELEFKIVFVRRPNE
jgi:transcriptional regulator with XRE-family HTH domain